MSLDAGKGIRKHNSKQSTCMTMRTGAFKILTHMYMHNASLAHGRRRERAFNSHSYHEKQNKLTKKRNKVCNVYV